MISINTFQLKVVKDFSFLKSSVDAYLNTLIQGDAIEVLSLFPDGVVDLIVADPPYNSMNVHWDKKDDEFQFSWLEQAKRVLKPGGSLYVFFAPLNMYGVEGYIRSNFTLKNLIVWYHPNLYGAFMSYGRDRYKSVWDVIFYAVKGDKAKHFHNVSQLAYINYNSGFDVMNFSQPRPLLHKGQKPLKLIEKLIFCSTQENDIVLDPFVGSGTTLLACLKLNRNFIGIEINEDYCILARDRINKELKQLSLFVGRDYEQSRLF